jgi:putative CocE/NonD family hydrolase
MTRDGVALATDLYFPGNGPGARARPALLLRTPYDKSAADRVMMAERWADAGYVFVVQDCRGRFLSDGVFALGQHEAEDGYDTIEWIGAQPWCNGRVGTVGTSYMAWVQSALATLNPPHLACMWVHEGIANGYKESLRQGGAFELRWMGWAFYGAATDPHLTPSQRAALQQVDLRDWLSPRLPLTGESPLALAPHMEQWFVQYLTAGIEGGVLDYRGINIEKHYPEHADVPTMYSGGWYDSYTRATIRNWSAMRMLKKSPQGLLMGPWTHGVKETGLTYAGNVDFGPDAAIDYFEVRRRWFDCWLKETGDQNPYPPVQYFLMGGGTGRIREDGRLDHGGCWLTDTTWPPTGSRPWVLFGTPDRRLKSNADGTTGTISFVADPQNPVPTIGGNLSFLSYLRPIPEEILPYVPVLDRLEPVIPIGGQNQVTYPGLFGAKPPYGPLNLRPDVVSFVSSPLARPVNVTGPVVVELTVASDAADTDFTAKLIDWYPPSDQVTFGYALNITDGIQRLRFREGTAHEVAYAPGTPVRLRIECYPTANRFMPGHRIRLDIASSNFPRFDINPNTGAPLGNSQHMVVAHQTILIDDANPLWLELLVSFEDADPEKREVFRM